MYPITIVDDFFEDPDAIVEMANGLKYYPPETGNWPGMRTKQLHLVEMNGCSITLVKRYNIYFTIQYLTTGSCSAHFQKIEPFADDQWDKRNQGWIHQDMTHCLVV